MRKILRLFSFTIGHRALCQLEGKEMQDKNAVLIEMRVGSTVRIRRSWRSPHAGRLGIVSAIKPNDRYGMYLIEFEDGLEFRYERHELEPTQARTSYYQESAVPKLLRFARLALVNKVVFDS